METQPVTARRRRRVLKEKATVCTQRPQKPSTYFFFFYSDLRPYELKIEKTASLFCTSGEKAQLRLFCTAWHQLLVISSVKEGAPRRLYSTISWTNKMSLEQEDWDKSSVTREADDNKISSFRIHSCFYLIPLFMYTDNGVVVSMRLKVIV